MMVVIEAENESDAMDQACSVPQDEWDLFDEGVTPQSVKLHEEEDYG